MSAYSRGAEEVRGGSAQRSSPSHLRFRTCFACAWAPSWAAGGALTFVHVSSHYALARYVIPPRLVQQGAETLPLTDHLALSHGGLNRCKTSFHFHYHHHHQHHLVHSWQTRRPRITQDLDWDTQLWKIGAITSAALPNVGASWPCRCTQVSQVWCAVRVRWRGRQRLKRVMPFTTLFIRERAVSNRWFLRTGFTHIRCSKSVPCQNLRVYG